MALIKINGVHGTQSFATAEDVQSVTNLDNLHDVTIGGSLSTGQYLVYNAVVNQWENVNTPPVVSALDDLTDVDTTGKLDNYVLTWDSTASLWEAQPGGHYTDANVDTHLNTSTALSSEVLSWTGTDYAWVTAGTGTVTPSSTDTFTNKSGSNSQWTNDEGYTTNTGDVTLTGTETLTNKTLTDPILEKITTGTGQLAIETDYSNPAWSSYNGTILLENYANTASNQINVLALKTNGNTEFVRFSAQGTTDDATLNSNFQVRGASNSINSKSTNGATNSPLTMNGSIITLASDSDIDMDNNPITNIESLTLVDTVGTNGPMIIGQEQYSPNSIEILTDKSLESGRSNIWWNFDNAGTKEYIGQQLWQDDGGSPGSGNHYFKLGTYPGTGGGTDVILDSWKNNYTRIGNGFHDSSKQPLGSLKLEQDYAAINGLALNVYNGRQASTGALGPNSLKVTTDMSQDYTVGIMNSATFALDYGISLIPTTYTQNTFTFQVQNDAGETAGTDPTVGRVAAVQNADPLENQIILTSSSHGNSGGNADNGSVWGGALSLNSYVLDTNVPIVLPVYTLTEANALSFIPEGSLIYVSNGNAGAKTLAVYDGSNWKVVALGATIS